jgi:hypothetical protein
MSKVVTNFTPQTCREVAHDLEVALADFAAERGLTIKIGGGKYDPSRGEFSPKVTLTMPEKAQGRVASDLRLLGIEAEYGTEFTSNGRRFKITGVNFKARKFPVTADAVDDGRGYKFPEIAVKIALGQHA